MPPIPRRPLSVLALSALAVAFASPWRQAPLPVGVVDFVKVFDNYPKYTEAKKQLDQQFKDALADENNKLQELRAQQDMAKPGTYQRAMADNDFEATLRHFQRRKDLLADKLHDDFAHLLADCYQEAEAVIARVAGQQQLALVLRRHDWLGTGADADKVQVYERRVVWHADQELDITAAVIKELQLAARDAAGKPGGH